MKEKISIAMTTYNGEKYIIRQLNSIINQTLLPDEVIIFDDCSSDSTAELIKEFIKKNDLKNWFFIQNENNKGWKKNFIDAIKNTTGDIIFCADQDDIWINDKIEKMSEIIIKSNNIQCLAGRFQTINDNDENIEYNKFNVLGKNSGNIIFKDFSRDINKFHVYGCTLAFTKLIKEMLLEYNYASFPHDAQIWQLSTLMNGAYFYDRVVIKYRIHNTNSGGVSINDNIGKGDLKTRIQEVRNYGEWLKICINILKEYNVKDKEYKKYILNKSLIATKRREEFLMKKNMITFIKTLPYIRFYQSKKAFIGDICYAFSINRVSGSILWKFSNIKNRLI